MLLIICPDSWFSDKSRYCNKSNENKEFGNVPVNKFRAKFISKIYFNVDKLGIVPLKLLDAKLNTRNPVKLPKPLGTFPVN